MEAKTTTNNSPLRGLVLSGGGGRGAYQCGVYKYLEEKGLEPDILVGTSIGAINATAIASGMSAEELEEMWLSMNTGKVHRYRLDFWRLFNWRNILSTSPWEKTLQEQIDFGRIATSPKRLCITAVDIETGHLKVFTNKEITVKHLLASCSIPVIYPWTRIGHSTYWDGGTMANTPLSPAIDEGAEEIYIVLLSPTGTKRMAPPRNIVEGLSLAFELSLLASFQADLKHLYTINKMCELGVDPDHRYITCHLIAPSQPVGLDLILRYERRHIQELIDLGYRDAQSVLSSGNYG